jgi:hypothetical protein
LWRELVERYHYLGHRVPFGAHLRYLIRITRPTPQVVGCLQFSSPAWRMAARERWIGWDEGARAERLQHIVNNSRFLILPWVRVRNLASGVLSQATRELSRDWESRYGLQAHTLRLRPSSQGARPGMPMCGTCKTRHSADTTS